MKILAVADVEDKLLYDHFNKKRVEGVELIVGCGDLRNDYMDFLISMINVPMIYVMGNHDDGMIKEPPLGAICIEDRIFEYKGVKFMGLGGSYRYNPRGINMYTERDMKLRELRLRPRARIKGGVDVLVTHSPAKGYGDLEDLPHRGFDCFNDILKKYKPKLFIHGHVHMNYGRNFKREYTYNDTTIINAYERYIIEI